LPEYSFLYRFNAEKISEKIFRALAPFADEKGKMKRLTINPANVKNLVVEAYIVISAPLEQNHHSHF